MFTVSVDIQITLVLYSAISQQVIKPKKMAEDANLVFPRGGVEETKSDVDLEGLDEYVEEVAEETTSVQRLQAVTQHLLSEQSLIRTQLQTIERLLSKLSSSNNTTTSSTSVTGEIDADADVLRVTHSVPGTRLSTPANHASPAGLPLSLRDTKTAAAVQKLCLQGIGMKFEGESKQLLIFNRTLKMKCDELGLTNALFIQVDGEDIDLTKQWNLVSYEEVQQYEQALLTSTESSATALAQNQALLKLLLTYSLESNFKIGIINVLDPSDSGPCMLVQILRQSTGTLAVTIENYEHIMKTSKLIDVEGMNFTKYYATMKPIADNLYSWNHFPVRAVATLIANTDGTENDAFNAVRLNALMDADTITGAKDQYEHWQATTSRLQATYINQFQSKEWEQGIKKREAHAISVEIMTAYQKGKLSIKNGDKSKPDKKKKKQPMNQGQTDWKKVMPDHNGEKEKVVDGKKYYWCGAQTKDGPCPSWGDHLRKDCPHKPVFAFKKNKKPDKEKKKEEKKEGMLALANAVDESSGDESLSSVEIKASYAFRE